MSSSGRGRTIITTGDLLGARTEGHRRQVRDGARVVLEAKTVASEVEVVIQEEGRIGRTDEETALRGGPLSGVRVIDLDATVELMRVAMTNRGTIRGRPLVGWARSSGPHWPQEGTGSNEVRDLLPRQGG